MEQDLKDAVSEIFQYKELLKDVVIASMNSPDVLLEKVFPIFEEMVELVETFRPFTIEEVSHFLDTTLIKYAEQPFFPVLAGLFVNALLNKLLTTENDLILNIEKLCYGIVDDAAQNSDSEGETFQENEVNFSLDFLGYLMPDNKTLTIQGPVGDYCGALMGENSTLIVRGMHGNHFGYEKSPSSEIIHKK